MKNMELAATVDTPTVKWAPWLTPRRAVLFVIAWLSTFALVSVFISNPFQSEPHAGVSPNYWNVMFMHGLLIGMMGLLALLTLQVMKVKSLHVRAWIVVGVVIATVLASLGGIFDKNIPGYEIPLWTQILGFFALDEILLMLVWGIYSERKQVLTIGRLPFVAGIAASASMLFAALLGHLAGWIMEFGESTPSLIADYRQWVGFGKQDDFTGALVGSHSHEMAVAAMAMGITLLVVQFGYSTLTGAQRWIARAGMGMVGLGTIAMTLFYVATGITTWAPPDAIAKFGTDPNVIPVDDIVTGILVMGGGVAAAAAFLPALVKTPIRLAAAWTYVLATATVAVAGYTIELNTSYFGAGDQAAAGAPGDAIFTWLHQDVGLFVLPTMLVVMLLAELLVTKSGRLTGYIGLAAIAGTTLLFAGGMAWVFITPVLYGAGFWISTAGILVTGAAILATLWYGGLAAALHPAQTPKPQLLVPAR